MAAVLASIMAQGGITPAQAQVAQQHFSFDVPARPAAQAVNQIARVAGLSAVFADSRGVNARANAVHGAMTPHQALSTALSGTGLGFRFTNATTVQIFEIPREAGASAADGQVVLDTVVLAAGHAGVTEGTGSYTTDQVSSSTPGLPLSIRDTPQSVSVITDQRIKDQRLGSTREVLAYTTGVDAYSGETDRDTTMSRGFWVSNYVVDGVNTPTYEGWYSGASVNSSAAIYDRVEVLRGAAGLLAGTGEPGAAVSMIRKRAFAKEQQGSVELRYGSWDRIGGTVDFQTPLTQDGRVRARFIADVASEDSYLDRYHVNRQTYYGTVEADLTDRTRLTFSLEHRNHDPRGSMWGEPPVIFSDGTPTDLGRGFSTGPDWAYWSSAQTSAVAKLDHEFDNGWKADATLGLTWREHASEIVQIAGYPDPVTGTGLEAYPFKSEEHNRLLSVDVNARGPVDLFGRTHTLSFGLHGDRDWKRQSWPGYEGAPADPGSIFDYRGGYPRPAFNDIALSDYAVNQTKYSAYGSGQFNLTDRAKLVLGARYTDWSRNTAPGELRFKNLTPYAGLVFDVTDTWSVYASYTEIFDPQNSRTRTGAYLEPVVGKSKEIGAKGEMFDGRMNISVALFDSLQDNVAVRDGTQTVPGKPDEWAYIGAKGVSSNGVELELSGEIRPGWNMFVGASALRLNNPTNDAYLSYMPTRTVKLFTTYDLPGQWDKWTVGGGARWQNKTWTDIEVGSGDVYRYKQSGYAVVDVMARYDLNDQWSAQLNVNNLFDKTYRPNASSGLYGPPRHALVTLTSRF